MIRALIYLQLWTTWNRLASQVRRLKKPKYLAGFLVGGLYFFFYFIQPLLLRGPRRRSAAASAFEWPSDFASGLETLGAAILAGIVLAAWIFPHSRAALTFSEAETAFLFPAPVRRRTLVHFKLLRSQVGILFTTLIMAFLTNRFSRGAGGSGWIQLAGWWLILSNLNLHFIGASFARTRLLDWGIGHWTRRAILLALGGGVVAASWWWLRTNAPQPGTVEIKDFKDAMELVDRLLVSQPIAGLLEPFRWVVRPFLARSAPELLSSAWPALLLLVGHYLWVIRSDVAFEEASLEQARRRAERVAAAQREPGKALAAPAKRRRPPFTLRPTGPPAVALLWKNLIGAGSFFTPRLWIVLGLALGFPAVTIGLQHRDNGLPEIASLLLLIALIWSVMLGPQLLRQDFRHDLRSAELLKLYPLPGWKIVIGELLAPAVILTAIQWTLLAALGAVCSQSPGGRPFPIGDRLSIGCGAAVLLPAINLVSLLIPNAAVLMFPAWVQVGPGGPQGIEATGQRLIFFLGQVLVFAISLLPSTAVFLGLHFLLSPLLGWQVVIPMACVLGSLLLLAEAALGIAFLGVLFEKLDVAAELRET